MNNDAKNLNEGVVTVVVSRIIKPGCEQEFEQISTAMSEAATGFNGHLGSTMLRPATLDDPEYRIVFKFNSQANLEAWQTSDIRAEYISKLDGLLKEETKTEVLSGMVTWFTLPNNTNVKPPPKYKMTLVSWLALYPSVSLIFMIFGDMLAPLPLLLRTLIITGVLMLLMSYVLMPRFTKWFAFWLYPKQAKDRS